MNAKDLNEILDQHLSNLGEHFDCVQILASFVDDNNGTHAVSRGTGNWYARQGLAKEFLERDQAQTAAHEMKAVIQPPDDGDSWKM